MWTLLYEGGRDRVSDNVVERDSCIPSENPETDRSTGQWDVNLCNNGREELVFGTDIEPTSPLFDYLAVDKE